MGKIKIYHALTTIILLIAVMFICIVGFGCSPHVPLAVGCIIAGFVAKWVGYRWEDVLNSMIQGITGSLEAVLILLCIGMMMGAWIACGTVPTMIYYGLKIINARFFLVMAFLFCGIISMAAGSWGTAGTVGLALVAIGSAMGIPAPMTAGAIVSGVYIGDKLSPISDATNLAAAVSGSDIVDVVKELLPVAAVSCGVASILYILIGLQYGGNSAAIEENIAPILDLLDSNFKIGTLGIVPLLIVIVCILFKIPSMVSIMAGTVSGGILAGVWQGTDFATILACGYNGYISETGSELLDNLLTAGGIQSMLYTVSIIILAMAFGGLMQGTGQMDVLVKPLARRVKSTAGLAGITMLSCLFCNIVLPDQYLGISVPGQMYREEYEHRGIKNTTLANILGAGGAVTSPLVPWNTCGAYMSSLLSATTMQYLPFCFFCLVLPFVTLAYVFLISRKPKVQV